MRNPVNEKSCYVYNEKWSEQEKGLYHTMKYSLSLEKKNFNKGKKRFELNSSKAKFKSREKQSRHPFNSRLHVSKWRMFKVLRKKLTLRPKEYSMDLTELAIALAFIEAVKALKASPGSANFIMDKHSGLKLPSGASSFFSASLSSNNLLLVCIKSSKFASEASDSSWPQSANGNKQKINYVYWLVWVS